MTDDVIHLAISRDLVLNSNDRIHHHPKARKTRAIREMGLVMARFKRLPKMPSARCDVTVTWTNGHHHDVANLAPTVKAAIDGIVGDYGLLPNDSDEYLQGPFLVASKEIIRTPGIACYLAIQFTPWGANDQHRALGR